MVIGSLMAFALSSLGGRPGRAAVARRGDVPGFGLARVEAPPGLRLSEQDRHEQKADDEGRREQLEVVADGRRPRSAAARARECARARTRAGAEQRLGGRAAWQILNAIFTMFKLGKRAMRLRPSRRGTDGQSFIG